MKIVIAPDSFKGTMSAPRAAEVMAAAFGKVFPEAKIVKRPVADGGEGTVDALLALPGAAAADVKTVDGYGREISARYCILGDKTAVIESASVVGLNVSNRRAPEKASTFGLGAQVRDALARGCKKLFIGLGGSGSNDAGCGLAAALGTVFYDRSGGEFMPVGKSLGQIRDYDNTKALELLEGAALRGLCDVTNPFYGPGGAARVFAPQKGADGECVLMLDAGMELLNEQIFKKTGQDLQRVPGSGSAGGLGGGICAFLGGRLESGIDRLLALSDFKSALSGADLCVCGEGSTDEQTLMGKALTGVLRSAGGVPVISISGLALPGSEELYSMGISAICGVNRVRGDFETVCARADRDLYDECLSAASLIRLGGRIFAKKK